MVGCLIARLAGKLPGCRVQLIDNDPGKAAVAALMGVAFAAPEQAAGAQDVLIHVSGSPAGLATALELAGFEATVVEASWFGTQPVSLALGENFHAKRLCIRSSQVGQVATAQRSRWTHQRRMAVSYTHLDVYKRQEGAVDSKAPDGDLARSDYQLYEALNLLKGMTLLHPLKTAESAPSAATLQK